MNCGETHLLYKSDAPWRSAWLGPGLGRRLQAKLLQPFIQHGFLYHTTRADGSEIDISDLECIRRVVADQTVLFDWRVGDTLLIDNKLVAHGGRPFQPPRKIFAALLADSPRKTVKPCPSPSVAAVPL